MKSTSWIVALFLIILLTGRVGALQENAAFAIKTEKGLLMVWNQPDNYFTLEIIGKDIRPDNSSANVLMMVDGRVLQIEAAEISQFHKSSSDANQNVAVILTSHRDWESKYLEGVLKSKLIVQTSPQKLKNGTEALAWSFNMPEGNTGEARKQLFLTSVSGKYVIVLNGVVTDTVNEETVRQFLVDTMATFKSSPTPFDAKVLQESLRKSRP